MKPHIRVTGLAVVFAIALSGLTGCGPGSAGSGGSPTVAPPVAGHPTSPASRPPVTPVPSFVDITAHGVAVGDTSQRQIASIPLTTDAATAAAQLGTAIGVTPTTETIPATSCAAAYSIYHVGGLTLSPKPTGLNLYGQFSIDASTPQTTNGLTIESKGQSVGVTLASLLAAVPGSVSGDQGEGDIVALLDGQDSNSWGVIVSFRAGVATDIYSPGFYLTGYGTC